MYTSQQGEWGVRLFLGHFLTALLLLFPNEQIFSFIASVLYGNCLHYLTAFFSKSWTYGNSVLKESLNYLPKVGDSWALERKFSKTSAYGIQSYKI